MTKAPGERLTPTENHVDWTTVSGTSHCTSTNPGHLNVRIFVSDGMVYFDDHNCHMLTAAHALSDGPYYLYVGATTEDKAFERDASFLDAHEFPGWNMLEFLTVRHESELVAAPAPNFRAANLLTPQHWYNPCAAAELFATMPTCFRPFLWDALSGGVAVGAATAAATGDDSMAKFHTTVMSGSVVSFVAKLDASFPFVLLTQASGDHAHASTAQTSTAFPKPPDGVTGLRVGYYAEAGVEFLYLANADNIVGVPVSGIAGEYVEVHVFVQGDKVSMTANVDGLNDVGPFTFSTYADSFGSTHAAHELAHAMTEGDTAGFDLYVGAVPEALDAGQQALFLSLSVVTAAAVAEPAAHTLGRKLLSGSGGGGDAELTAAEAALNWAGPVHEAATAKAGARLLLAASWENQPKETLSALESQLEATQKVSDALLHQTKAQVELYAEYAAMYATVATQLAAGEHVALDSAYGSHSLAQPGYRRTLLTTAAEWKKKAAMLKLLESATAKRNLYALYFLWRKELHLSIHHKFTALRSCAAPDYDLPRGRYGENLLFPQFWQMTLRDSVTYALLHAERFVPTADSALMANDGADYVAIMAASQPTQWDALNGGLQVNSTAQASQFGNPGARFYRRVPAGAEIHVTWRDGADCAQQYVMVSTNPSPGAFAWEAKPDAVTFVWDCATKSIYTTSDTEGHATAAGDDAAAADDTPGEFTVVMRVSGASLVSCVHAPYLMRPASCAACLHAYIACARRQYVRARTQASEQASLVCHR